MTLLPQLDAPLYLTDGGAETALIFDDGIDLPDFAASPLLDGHAALTRYYERYAAWANRLRGIRANAPKLGHAELDEAEALDRGDPAEFADDHRKLRTRFPQLTVLGGCCGTDHRHVDALSAAFSG
ncbi:homocysteine S-methyltransferase family protein [Lentzea sp. NPDC051208]|uniref:homocysteine S-methyltransferase family protein n=1 Tax=Lentzea sp. NPDC051208 TaxID=3154642 RepID=UPI00341878E4